MSTFRDVVARMAIDPDFARHVRGNPEQVGREQGLTPAETARLRELSDARAGVGPLALGARLSKSGIGSGGIAGLLDADLPLPDADPVLPDAGSVLSDAAGPVLPGAGPTHLAVDDPFASG